jgi:hypothetical protein
MLPRRFQRRVWVVRVSELRQDLRKAGSVFFMMKTLGSTQTRQGNWFPWNPLNFYFSFLSA